MSSCRLRERATVKEPCYSRLAARGVIAVDEVSGWEERYMLEEGQLECEPAGVPGHPARQLVVDEPEDCAVQRVHHESERSPAGAARERLAEDGDVRVVVAEEPPIDGLQRAPDDRGERTRSCCSPAWMHTLEPCPKGTLFIAPPVDSRFSSASGSRSRRRIRARA